MNQIRDFDRAEAVRLRRMKDCFEAARPDQAEVLSAIRRWNQFESRQRPGFSLRAAWFVAVALMLSGGAMAASGVLKLPSWSAFRSNSKQPQPVERPSTSHSSQYVVERGGRRMQYREPVKLTLLPGEHAALIVDNTRTELVGPGVAQIQAAPQAASWVTRFEPQVWVPELEMSESLPSPSNNLSASTKQEAESLNNAQAIRQSDEIRPRTGILPVRHLDNTAPNAANNVVQSQLDGAWSRAASALRRGDDIGATAALSEISNSNDPSARDAALLAQAQLDLAAGRQAKAMPVLNQLSQNGTTAFVRQRAREILVNGN